MSKPIFQYRFSERPRSDGSISERHDWCIIGEAGAVNIWAEPDPSGAKWRERWFGGVECHWRKPPDYYEGKPPHHERCWLLGKACWHDGSSLFFSERIEPHLPDPDGKQMDGSINDLMLYHLRDWYGDRIEPASVDTHPQGGDPAQTGAPAPLSGAVPSEETADAQNPAP